MHFIISSFVLALAATTVVSMPSPAIHPGFQGLASGPVRRAGGSPKLTRQADSSSQTAFTVNTAGAFLNTTAGAITGATGSLVIPSISVPQGEDPSVTYTAGVQIGIDSQSCPTGAISGGVQLTLSGGSQSNSAFILSFPEGIVFIEDFSISTGDNITISVSAQNATSGTVVFINQSTNQTVSLLATSGTLCMQEADWFVGDFDGPEIPLPFVNFGALNFTGASAETPTGSLDISGASILDIEQNGTVLTSVLASPSTVDIAFL
ncbi:uncharacterized protein PHACADRAFT_265552, partial [Phanerochaete carnosa HHB-10118-sp]